MHHLSRLSRRKGAVTRPAAGCQDQVRFFALLRIKPHAPPLVRVPVNSFEFHSCERTRGLLNAFAAAPGIQVSRTPSNHRLPRGLPGYLILFAPHAFEPQRQSQSSRPPSPPVFLLISTHFTATLGIPPTPPALQQHSFQSMTGVEPRAFTPDLHCRLRSLYTQ